MKTYHVSAALGILCLVAAFFTKIQEQVGGFMVAGLLMFALAFVFYITRR
jgi:hypothetical protein